MKHFFIRAVTALALASMGCLAFFFLKPLYFVALLALVLVYVLVIEWPRFNIWWLTPWYPMLPYLALTHLYLQNSLLWAWLVVVVAAYDTGGYIVGTIWGKDKIIPRISPGKTWQGLLGGIFFAGFLGSISGAVLLKSYFYSIIYLYVASCLVAFLAFIGDFFESYLKRRARIKDSGTILPGHGGLLDRIDGLLCAAVFCDCICFLFYHC